MIQIASKVAEFEAICRGATDAHLQNSSAEFQKAMSDFDALLQHYYLFSCCHWGCHGKEHTFEHLGGRCVSHILSAYKLIRDGYYDESLSLVRSVGEIANLLNLFWVENSSVRDWLGFTEPERRKEFTPYKVRQRLMDNSWAVPFDDDHYKRLCQTVVHPTPDTRPNAHDDGERPVLGAYFQKIGFENASWELFYALSTVAGPIAKIADLKRDQAEIMVALTIPLFKSSAMHVTVPI